MKYTHIIWDWNGTVLDDAWLCREVMNGMLVRRGLPQLTLEKYAQIFDFPVKAYYQRAGWDFEKVPFEVLSDEFIEEYDRRKVECPLRAGAVEILKRNAQNDLPQSIISASKQTSLEKLVSLHGIQDLFTSVRGLDNHHAFGKTYIGLQWINELGMNPKEILMIGDTTHDHVVAQAMGVDCVLVSSGHQNRARLEMCGVPVVGSLDELDF
jgi:phosphoglycolate phosphatase